jgi:hypothetical protein
MATYGIEEFAKYGNTPFLPTVRGGAVDNAVTWPWQTSIGTNNWNAPQYAGGIPPTMVDTTTVTNPKGSSIPGAPWNLDSGYRSTNDLLAMLGSASSPTRLAAAPTYAPWGATSRSLAFNALNPSQPQDPMTVAANEAAANFLANPPDFGGRDVGGAPLGSYGGEATKAPASAAARPRGLAGLLDALFGQSPRMDVASKLDVSSPAQRYSNANAAAQLNAILAPRTGSAGGYQYQGGQKVGYAPIALPDGSSVTPTSGAQAYSLSNAASQARAISNSAEPSKNAARASLAAQWGFD